MWKRVNILEEGVNTVVEKNGELGDLQPSVQSISGHLQMQFSNLLK